MISSGDLLEVDSPADFECIERKLETIVENPVESQQKLIRKQSKA